MRSITPYVQKLLPFLVIVFIVFNAFFAGFGEYLFAPEDVKTFAAMIAVFPLLTLWAWSARTKETFLIAYTPLYIPMALFFLWCIISLYAIALDIELASYTTYQYATMIATFVLVVQTLRSTKHILLCINTLLIVATLISSLALLQFYFPNNEFIAHFVYQAVPPAGTFGNKNMLGHFLAISLPLAIAMIFVHYKSNKSLLYVAASVLFATILTYIHTRASWLGFGIAFLVLISVLFLQRKKFNPWTKKIILFCSLAVVIWFVIIISNETVVQTIQEKIHNTLNTQNPRISLWANTLPMIYDHPITGVGIGGWSNEYIRYYDSVLLDGQFNEKVRAERLHNEYLELLANLGVVGMLLFLWAVGIVAKYIITLLRTLKDETLFYLTLGITGAVVAFAVNAFFSFPVRVFFPAFLILALIGMIVNIQHQYHPQYTRHSKQFGYLLSLPIMMLGAIFIWQSSNILLSKNYYYEAQALSYSKNPRSLVIERLFQSVYHNPDNALALSLLGEQLVRGGKPASGIAFLERSIALLPYLDFSYLRLAMAYDAIGEKEQAIKALTTLISIDNKNVTAHGQLARLYLEKGDILQATQHKELMLKWQKYFDNRQGFGPYDTLVTLVLQKFNEYNTK